MVASTSGFTRSATRACYSAPRRQRVNQRQFRLGLAVETMNAAFERILDLIRRFSHPGEHHLRRVAARFQNAEQLAAGDNVEARTRPRQQPQDRQVGVGFHRITDPMGRVAECPIVCVGSGSRMALAEYT